MAEKGIKIRFDVDDSPIKSALTRIDKEAKKLQTSLKNIDKLLEMDPTNVTLLTQKQALLSKSVETTTEKLKALEEAQERITNANTKWHSVQEQLEKNTSAIRDMMDNIDAANQKMQEMNASGISEDADEYKEVANQVKEYEAALKELRETQKTLKNEQKNNVDDTTYQNYIVTVESLKINLNQLEQQEQDVAAAMEAASQGADGAANTTEAEAKAAAEAAEAAEREAQAEQERQEALKKAAEAEKEAKEASAKYEASLKSLKDAANNVKNDFNDFVNVIKKGTEVLASATVAGTTAATKIGIDFTSSMSKVEAYSEASAEDLAKMTAAAREAGATTSKTATQSADALGYMALAGWSTEEMLAALTPTLRASEASEMDLATCADLVTDSMSALGLGVDSLTRYLDVAAYAQSNSNTSMEQLLEAYIECGGTLNNLNVSIEESAGLLGVLANRGTKASEAGKNLNSIIVNLVGANSKASTAMSELGVSAWDEEGNFIGLTETIELLDDALSNCTQEQKTLFEAAIGGKTQMDTLQKLIAGVNDEYNSLVDGLENCDGALEKTAETMQDNLGGDITKLQSAIQETGNEIYENLEEPFREATQESIKSIEELNSNLDSAETAEKLKNIATALGELYNAAVDFAADTVIPDIIDFLNWIAEHSDLVISGLYGMGAAWALIKLATIASDLNKVVIQYKAMTAACIENTAAVSGNTAALATESFTLKEYAEALQVSKVAQLGLYAGLVALTAMLAKYAASALDAKGAALMAKNALNEETQAVYDQANAYKELSEQRKTEISSADESADKSLELWQRITELADAEGNAVGDVKDLENAITEFNAVSGQNIEVVNGQIQGYDDLKNSIAGVIEETRKQAKLKVLEEDYGNALLNINEAKANVEAAEKELLEMQENAKEAKANMEQAYRDALAAGGDGFIKLIDFTAYYEAQDISEQADDALAQAYVRYGSLKEIVASLEDVINQYEDISNGSTTTSDSMTKEEATRYAAQQEADKLAKINKENAEAVVKAREETQTKLEAKLDALDEQLATRKITDSEYWKKKAEYIEKYRDEENSTWWKYYKEVEDHNEEEIKTQIEALKDKQEINDEYTEEMMYNEIAILIKGLDEESSVYQKYNQEILKYRKELASDAADAIKEGLKEDVDAIESSIKEVQDTYKSSMDSILSEKESYYNKLSSLTDLTSTSTQTDANGNTADIFSLTDPEEALKALDDWESRMADIEARGASDNVINWIDSLDAKTAEQTMEVLSKMTDENLKQYSDNFDKLQDKKQEMADNKYQSTIDELNNQFIEKVDGLIKQLPEGAQVAGYETVESFVAGLTDNTGSLYDSVSEFTNNLLTKIRENLGINSPSKETETLGEYTAEGFAVGMNENKASQIADSFVEAFIEELKLKDPDIQKALQDSFSTDVDLTISSVKTSIDSLSSIASQTPTLPSSSTVSSATSTASQEKENSTKISQLLSSFDNLISLIQKGQANNEQVVKLAIDVSGQLTADADEISAVVATKLNDIAIRTGKGALIN